MYSILNISAKGSIVNTTTDVSHLEMIGARVRQERLNQNTTQSEVASTAGVALNVVKQLESGKGCALRNFIRILRALGKLDQIDLFLPEPGISPLQLVALEGRRRKGASGKRGRKASGA